MLQVKVYNRTYTTLKETIKGTLLISDISFTCNKNGGQGELTLKINKSLTNDDYTLGDIIKIIKYTENNKEGVNLYMGYVNYINRIQNTSQSYIELSCLGLASIFTENEISKSYAGKKAGVLMEEIVDAVNIEYGEVFNKGTIEEGPTMGTGTAEGTYFDILTQIAESAEMYWYVDGNGTFTFKSKDSTPTHYLTNKKDLESIDIKEDMEGLVNSVKAIGNYVSSDTDGGTTYYRDSQIYSTYTDSASVALYGIKKDKVEIKANSQAIVDDYAESYVNQRKDPKKETSLVVNTKFIGEKDNNYCWGDTVILMGNTDITFGFIISTKYGFDEIKPGDTVKVRNFEYTFINIQIEKIQYTQDRLTLYLDRYISLGEQIKKVF